MARHFRALKSRPATDGYTLFEVLVTIAIVAILAAVAVPSMRSISLNNARTSVVGDVLGVVLAARNEAMKRGVDVKVCSTADGISCSASKNDWERGLMAFLDTDNSHAVNGTEARLHYTGQLDQRIKINSNLVRFEFRPFNIPSSFGTMSFCDERGVEQARAIIVSKSGRPHVAAYGESNVSWSC